MSKPERLNQLTRCIRIVTKLAPEIISGLSVTELAEKTGLAAAVVCRDLESLREIGWTQKLDTGRWSLTTKPIGLADACNEAMKKYRERQDDFRRNVTIEKYRILEEE